MNHSLIGSPSKTQGFIWICSSWSLSRDVQDIHIIHCRKSKFLDTWISWMCTVPRISAHKKLASSGKWLVSICLESMYLLHSTNDSINRLDMTWPLRLFRKTWHLQPRCNFVLPDSENCTNSWVMSNTRGWMQLHRCWVHQKPLGSLCSFSIRWKVT